MHKYSVLTVLTRSELQYCPHVSSDYFASLMLQTIPGLIQSAALSKTVTRRRGWTELLCVCVCVLFVLHVSQIL
jgi:hypothetical protein